VEYFRAYPVFDRLLCGFREKYASYGSFSGTVMLRHLTAEDIEALEGFFLRSFHGQKSASISAAHFEKALKNSRFDQIEPKTLLELYFREEMTGRRQQRQEEEARWRQMLEVVGREYAGTPAEVWINELGAMEKSSEWTKFLAKAYRESGKKWDEVARVLHLGAQIINAFPYREEKQEYLAVFAALLTGNPHAFDDGERDSTLLQMLIRREVQSRGIEIPDEDIFPAIRKQKLYLQTGILRDDISNYAMLSGVRAWKKDGSIHEGMEGFSCEGDMVQVPLGVISRWAKLYCPDQEIYIMENPSIYAMFCRKWKGSRACMCMNGQPRLSSILVMDLLADAGVRVSYAGDFDPEGLLIAQRIRQYYRGAFSYWQMSPDVYEMTGPSAEISERRLRMLDRITDPELLPTAEALRHCGFAGYQENVWEVYLT
jgi:uncharacterized protein (TIGR02679 family)